MRRSKMPLEAQSLDEVWKDIARQIKAHPEYIKGLKEKYNIEITGDASSLYSIDFSESTFKFQKQALEEADCKLILNEDHFRKLLKGDLNTTASFMMGKLKVK